MDDRLFTIAKEYFYRAESVKDILLRGLDLKTKEELIKFKGKMPAGTFYIDNMKNEFYFHGRGLRFHRENYSCLFDDKNHDSFDIDMEIGYGSFWCGISAWMLYKYIVQYYPNLSVEFNHEKLSKNLREI